MLWAMPTCTPVPGPRAVILFHSGLDICVATDLCASSGEQRSAGQTLMTPPGGWALSLQSSTQEIGEELVNGVVYSISLRKVQVHHGTIKGQRWLGVSAPRRPRGPDATLVTPLGVLAGLSCLWAPQSCSQRSLGPASPPLPSPGLGQVQGHCSHTYVTIREDTSVLVPLRVTFALGPVFSSDLLPLAVP